MTIASQDQKLFKSVAFRPEVQTADREVVRQLVQAAGLFSALEIEVALELVEEHLAKGPSSGYNFLFAERNGQVLGYACYGPIALTAASFDLYWIVVDKTCQGNKISKALMAKTEELIRAAGGRQIYIETSHRDQYTAAQNST